MQTGSDSESVEGLSRGLGDQGGTAAGDEEGVRPRLGAEPVPAGRVAGERVRRALLQRDQPRSAELGLAHRDDARAEVDVASPQADRLPDPHAAAPKKPEEGLVGQRAQCGAQLAGSRHQVQHFGFLPQVWRRALVARSKDVVGRDLGRRVDRLQVPGEATHHAEPVCPHDRLDAWWELGEGNGQLGGDARRAGGVEIVDELGEQRAVEGQLEAERPA